MDFKFEIGKTYRVKPKNNACQVLDLSAAYIGNIEVVTNDSMTICVLAYPENLPGFIRVFNVEKQREHLYFTAQTEQAVLCSESNC